jgi:phosphatidylethanolamine-binding protein (PEBP) family uncharacterized protein
MIPKYYCLFVWEKYGVERNMQLTSSAFQDGAAIAAKFTCEGKDVSPELSWRDAGAFAPDL